MTTNVTIPKLGNVSRRVQVAPFQIPNSLPGWTTPKFVNGTGNIGILPNGSYGGYWGLNYIYTNSQFTTQPGNVFDLGAGWQIAGGCVQSFGIFDFYSGPSATGTMTAPYNGGSAERLDATSWAQGPNSLYMYRTNSSGGGIWPGYIKVAKFPLPNVMFARTIQKGTGPDFSYSYSCTLGAAGNLFVEQRPVYLLPPVYGGGSALAPLGFGQNVNVGNPATASVQVSAQPIKDPFNVGTQGQAITSTPYLINTNVLTTGGLVGSAGQWASTFSPVSGLYGGFLSGTGLVFNPIVVPSPMPLLATTNNPRGLSTLVATLSDATDQADITGFRLGGGWTVAPDGNFWVQSPNNGNIFYVIGAQLTGYYKVTVQGVTLAGNWASGGYGVDTNGNFWSFTSVAGQLASTLGLPQPPVFLPFPQVSASWVGCRRNECAYPWYG